MKNILKFSFLLLALSLFAACKDKKGADAKVNDKAGEVKKAEGKKYAVSSDVSKVLWEGSKPTGSHNGTVNISEGSLTVADNKINGGEFTIDMGSITVLDLTGDKKGYLEGHLKGLADDNADDFFNVNKFPKANFVITKVTEVKGDENSTHLVYGNLTMKDITKEVGFKANVSMSDGSVKVTTPQFTIDRTQWGIKYGSPSFFEGLKDKAIDNNMGLKINLVANG